MRLRYLCTTSLALLTAACASTPTGVATNPPVTSGSDTPATSSPGASASSGAIQSNGTRTILSPLGLNLRASASTSGAKLGALSQGAQVSVMGYSADSGGWYHVQGATTSGWITADPSLSAPGTFVNYSSAQRGFGLYYPSTWTFAEEANDVVFRPQSGPDSVVVRSAATASALGSPGNPGYVNLGDTQVIVCGVTGDQISYGHSGTGSATPASSTAPLQPYLAQIRLKLDATHAMGLDFNYTNASDLDTFGYFYNSITFPFPQCQQVATPAPSPTP